MSNRLGPVLILLAVLGLTGAALYFATHAKPPPVPPSPTPGAAPPPAPAPSREKPLLVDIAGASLEDRGPDGKLRWHVQAAGTLGWDKAGDNVNGTRVNCTFYRAGKAPVTVVAPKFVADYKTRRLVFTEGVKGTLSEDAGVFAVPRLEYEFGTRKLIGSGGVRFRKGDFTATAGTLIVDLNARQVRLRDGVKFTNRR